MDLIKKFNQVFFAENNQGNMLRKIVIMGMIGILLLLIGSIFSGSNSRGNLSNDREVSKPSPTIPDSDYESELTGDLEKLLTMINGVGQVKVKLYITQGEKYHYEYNEENTNKITTESDQNGGEREIQEATLDKELVIVRDSAGNEKPVIMVTKKPEIEGILIVAEGAERSEIKYKITRAVSNFMDLPLYKINVLPGRGGN